MEHIGEEVLRRDFRECPIFTTGWKYEGSEDIGWEIIIVIDYKQLVQYTPCPCLVHLLYAITEVLCMFSYHDRPIYNKV